MTEQAIWSHAESSARDDAESARLTVLRLLEQRPEVAQRELAEALGLSLGKAHQMLHLLFEKGLVEPGNFRRSDHKLACAYGSDRVAFARNSA